jgi:hyperosmotically inducible periplasmic protein
MEMKTNASIALAAVVAAAMLAGCETRPPYESNAAAVDDATITANVKAALVQDPQTRGSNISVNTIHERVELTGFVNSPGEGEEAARVAGSVPGVGSVNNQLQVNGGGPVGGYAGGTVVGSSLDDRTISYNVAAALNANPETRSARIKVTTANGVVQLAGFVDTNDERAAAGSIAGSVQGVRAVDNDLRLAD